MFIQEGNLHKVNRIFMQLYHKSAHCDVIDVYGNTDLIVWANREQVDKNDNLCYNLKNTT